MIRLIENVNDAKLKRARVFITNEDIINGGIDPSFVIVEGKPGVFLKPVSDGLIYDFSHGAYSNVDAAFYSFLHFDGSTAVGFSSDGTGAADMESTNHVIGKQVSGAYSHANLTASSFINLPIVLTFNNNGAGALNGGGDGNFISISVLYEEIEL